MTNVRCRLKQNLLIPFLIFCSKWIFPVNRVILNFSIAIYASSVISTATLGFPANSETENVKLIDAFEQMFMVFTYNHHMFLGALFGTFVFYVGRLLFIKNDRAIYKLNCTSILLFLASAIGITIFVLYMFSGILQVVAKVLLRLAGKGACEEFGKGVLLFDFCISSGIFALFALILCFVIASVVEFMSSKSSP